jgi:hypothetical protein
MIHLLHSMVHDGSIANSGCGKNEIEEEEVIYKRVAYINAA